MNAPLHKAMLELDLERPSQHTTSTHFSCMRRRFSGSCLGPFWEVDLLGSGHLSFLDETGEVGT